MNWLRDMHEKIKARRMLFVVSTIAILVVAVVTMAVIFAIGGRGTAQPGMLQVFFFNPEYGHLEPEGRPWPTDDLEFWVASGSEHWDYNTKIVWVGSAIALLSQQPYNSRLTSVWPSLDSDTLFFLYFHISDSTLVATFCNSYLEMAPLEEALFRSAFTLTMLSLPFVDDVVIRTGYTEFAENATTIANAPTISSAWLANTQLILYFWDDTGEIPVLVREYYNAMGVDIQRRSRAALERLIEGPESENMTALIPPETRIIGVIPAPEIFSVYVNLSSEFVTRFGGSPTQARLMIQSIVNTVIENSSPPGSPAAVRQVFFLIDSARHDTFPGVPDFYRGFEYDEGL